MSLWLHCWHYPLPDSLSCLQEEVEASLSDPFSGRGSGRGRGRGRGRGDGPEPRGRGRGQNELLMTATGAFSFGPAQQGSPLNALISSCAQANAVGPSLLQSA